jgi:hypothetical protein
MGIGAQAAAIFVPAVPIVVPVRAGQHNASGDESFAQGVAVVGAVADQVLGIAPVRRDPRLQRRVDERDFRRRGRGDGDSQRNTLTLDRYHAH